MSHKKIARFGSNLILTRFAFIPDPKMLHMSIPIKSCHDDDSCRSHDLSLWLEYMFFDVPSYPFKKASLSFNDFPCVKGQR